MQPCQRPQLIAEAMALILPGNSIVPGRWRLVQRQFMSGAVRLAHPGETSPRAPDHAAPGQTLPPVWPVPAPKIEAKKY
jgi:hypothetical protein